MRVFPLRTADRRKKHGVGVQRVLQHLVRARLAEAVDAVAAERSLDLSDTDAKAGGRVIEYLRPGRHHLRTDSVARRDDDAPVLHRAGQPLM